jgi:hypothetical protein
MNNRYARAVVAGFVATAVLSVLMLVKGAMGMLPQMNVIHMLAAMAHAHMSLPASPVVGWMAHFFIGTVLWGIGFALLQPVLPGSSAVRKALSFSVLAWLLMMLIPLPMAGAGLFGLKLGPMAPVMTLALHLVWGAVLGAVYDRLGHTPLTAEAG